MGISYGISLFFEMIMNYDINALTFALGKPRSCGIFKASPEDFRVGEHLGFELTGSGEHQCLYIEKQGLNTEELVRQLSAVLSKPTRLISYAGLKDRQAVTTQWISVHCPGETIEGAASLKGDKWRVVKAKRHTKKIRHGAVKNNRFEMIIRKVSDTQELEDRLFKIKETGVPNYFGPQRFGIQGQNIVKAENMLLKKTRVKDRFLRGMYFSAARSFLFNKILSARVALGNWQEAIPGDVMQLAGSHSFFHSEVVDALITQRIKEKDISPASILWGKQKLLVTADALSIQEEALMGLEHFCEALLLHDLTRGYRAHKLDVEQLSWEWDDNQLKLYFTLTTGGYATSVLRELIISP